MNGRKMTAVLVAATMTGALGMSGCGQDQSPGTHSTSAPGPRSATTSPTAQQSTELLMLNDSLKAKLGSAYSDSWIEDKQLHVAVTTQDAAKVVSEAGAIPKLVDFDAAQLEAALRAVAAWQATLPQDQAAAIHRIITDGRSGTVTIYVTSEQINTVSAAAAKANPTGRIPLAIKESTGLATPL
ncbi:hypothetical protein CVV68_15440 [Arthrobacter livingstonensis]|uniref:Uncharacterized protein n=1 Tax=Arthrobacter livingstonensis TaxID=670078 RepID=A0A2V5L940_9MICC|nr:hypothetical protein [Arthrobacter livingstonensis]PYI66183.1 hypothetical protein CVV68_15440 [Arthrobacter livingstonensis]